ncbi:MAG: N-6 DNA methylase [Pirellula sp.]
MQQKNASEPKTTDKIGFEAKLWLIANKLRNKMGAAEYKHVLFGMILLKYIYGKLEEQRSELLAGQGDYAGANAEDPDEYKAENVFGVPTDARRSHLQASVKLATISTTFDQYFLTWRVKAMGKNDGQFYTLSCVVRCLVDMLIVYKCCIYDQACGSGGILVESEKFVESLRGTLGDISISGQESDATMRGLSVINRTLLGIEVDFGAGLVNTIKRAFHTDLRADYVLANKTFFDSDWFRMDDNVRWQYGVPPKGNANFALVRYFIHCELTVANLDNITSAIHIFSLN